MKTVLSFPRELLPLRTSIRAAFLFFAFGLLALTASAASPDTGTLEGLVMDASTGIVLEGAEVAIDGADHSVSVERGGRFAIRNLAPGSHRLTFRYPGLDDKTMDVTVAAGENPRLMVELGERAIQLETFKVEGTKEGMAQAVALQKSADEGKIVAANTKSRAATMDVDVDGDGKADARIQIGPAIRGTALRDVLDFVDFNSFTNQIDYARFGKSLNTYANRTVLSKLPHADLEGRTAKVLGAFAAPSGTDLPLVTKPMLTRLRLMREAFMKLIPGAPFVQFTYSVAPPIPKSLPGVLTQASERIWMNVPPARVWVYRGK